MGRDLAGSCPKRPVLVTLTRIRERRRAMREATRGDDGFDIETVYP
jgi:hypothetical protein